MTEHLKHSPNCSLAQELLRQQKQKASTSSPPMTPENSEKASMVPAPTPSTPTPIPIPPPMWDFSNIEIEIQPTTSPAFTPAKPEKICISFPQTPPQTPSVKTNQTNSFSTFYPCKAEQQAGNALTTNSASYFANFSPS